MDTVGSLQKTGKVTTLKQPHPLRKPLPVHLLSGNLNGKALAASGTAALNDKTAIFGGHANEKAVGSFTADVAWLICSFH